MPETISYRDRRTVDTFESMSVLRDGGIDIEHRQIEAGRFEGRLREVGFGGVRMFAESQNREVLKQAVCTTSYTIGFERSRLDFDFRVGMYRRVCNQVFFLPRNVEADGQCPGGSEVAFFLVDQAELLAAAEAVGNPLAEGADRLRIVDAPSGHALAKIAEALLQVERRREQAGMLPDACYVERLVLAHVLDTFDAGAPVRPVIRARAWQIAHKAREFIDAMTDEPLTVLDVCRSLHVSRRTLQYSFTEIYGLAPLAYLRLTRLNRARHQLLLHGAGTTVAEAATRWGFWHLARFAQDYRRQFGEFPSQTLRRA